MNKRKRKLYVFFTTLIMMVSMAVPVFADTPTAASTDDPITVISNLNGVIFGVIRGIGIGFAGFGFFQIGTSIPSHDAGQRAIGIASCVGGIIMIFAKQILTAIGVV